MSEIAGRHILITGGASGIERLMARKLAGLGGRRGHPDQQRRRGQRPQFPGTPRSPERVSSARSTGGLANE